MRGDRDSRTGRKKGPTQVGSVLDASFASLGIAAKVKEHRVKKAWTEAVGPLVAKKTAPLKLIGTTLHCSVASSPWMTELTYQKPGIITKINAILGEEAVKEVVLRVGNIQGGPAKRPAPPRRELTEEERELIEKTTSPVTDENLRSLIKRVMERSKTG